MKKVIILIIISLFISIFSISCSSNKDYMKIAKQLYNEDSHVDFIIVNDTVYINAAKIDWVMKETLTKSFKLGEIKRSHITSNYGDFDATVSSVGTVIYETIESDEILLLESHGVSTPYLSYVEG